VHGEIPTTARLVRAAREPVSCGDACTANPSVAMRRRGSPRTAFARIRPRAAMKLRIAVPERVRNLRPAPAAGAPAGAGLGLGQRLYSQGPQLATLLLAAAIAAQLAVLAWKFVAPPAPVAAPPPAAPARPAFDPARLQAAALFGAAAQAPQSSESAPRTNVPLVLVGTLAGPQPEQGLAILGESPQAARVYMVGATLPGGVKLHSVYPDRVVIDRGGTLETLPLPRQMALGTNYQAPAVSDTAPGVEPPLAESVQRLIESGPEVVGEMIRPMPDFANGQLRGFRVYPGRDRRMFAKLGLQPGDLVTQINGVPLTDAQRGLEILRGLGNAGQANVTVERAGSLQQLSVNASQLSAAELESQVQAPRQEPPEE
jgi:general secretion pathway protein C